MVVNFITKMYGKCVNISNVIIYIAKPKDMTVVGYCTCQVLVYEFAHRVLMLVLSNLIIGYICYIYISAVSTFNEYYLIHNWVPRPYMFDKPCLLICSYIFKLAL